MRDTNYEIEIREIDLSGNNIIIDWAANIGWGQWSGSLEEDGKLHVDTEGLDTNDDKLFTKQLLQALLEKIEICS